MQPYFGANPGRERGFAGDFAANSGLVDRIRVTGSAQMTTTRTHATATRIANVPEYRLTHRRVPPSVLSSRQKVKVH